MKDSALPTNTCAAGLSLCSSNFLQLQQSQKLPMNTEQPNLRNSVKFIKLEGNC